MIIQINPSLVSGHDNHFLQASRPNKSKSYQEFTLKTGAQCNRKVKRVLVGNRTFGAMIKIITSQNVPEKLYPKYTWLTGVVVVL